MTEMPTGSDGISQPTPAQSPSVAPVILQPPPPPQVQSGWGVASLVLGCMAVPGLACGFVVSMSPEVHRPHSGGPEHMIGYRIGQFAGMLCLMAGPSLAGLVMGIVGVRQPNRKRGVAIAGLVVSGVMVLLSLIMLLLGWLWGIHKMQSDF